MRKDRELPSFLHPVKACATHGRKQVTSPDDLLAEHLAEHMTKTHRKRKLRQQLRERIETNEGDSSAVVSEIREYLAERPNIAVVAIYSAMPGEADLHMLLEDKSRIWVFPRVTGNDLVFCRVKSLAEDLVTGAFGILEPRNKLKPYAISKIDLFLCPGLGFDRAGARIGRGRGFYDRILAKARPDAVKLGVCFGFQLVEKIDIEEHDIRMNGMIAG